MRRVGKDFSGAKIALKARPAGGATAPTDDAGFARGVLMLVCFLVALQVATPAIARKAPREGYRTAGLCDGYPRVALTIASKSCVGLVATKLGFPRGLALIGSDVYVADLASRTPGRGRILRLAQYGRGAPEIVLSGLNQPNGLAADDKGRLYVGEVGRVIRFDPKAADPRVTITLVMTGLPSEGRHNLTGFVLAPDGGLIVNVGSFSDNCETPSGGMPTTPRCPELQQRPPRGSLLRIAPGTPLPVAAANAEIFASGIRNAIALAYLPGGTLMAASNGRDNIDSADPKLSDEALPHDLLLRIVQGGNYGWPYCFDAGRASPEFPLFDCRTVRAPALVLAPHAAPLGMIRYGGTRFPALTGKLLLAYHGYRARGHRLVAVAVDASGVPSGGEVDVVSGWTGVAGLRPQGMPAALLELPDGSVLIAEDQNRSLLRLSTLR